MRQRRDMKKAAAAKENFDAYTAASAAALAGFEAFFDQMLTLHQTRDR